MRYFYTVLIALLVLPILPVEAEDRIATVFADSAIVIDGKIDDWNRLEPRYYTKNDMVMGICNNSDYLYIQLRFRNEQQVAMIRRGGLTIWIDNKGKKQDFYRLRYNGGFAPIRERMMDGSGGEPRGGDSYRLAEQNPPDDRLQQLEEIELSCYREGWRSPRIYAFDGADPVAAAFDTSYSFSVYEFRIPLGDSLHVPDGIEMGGNDDWSLGIEMAELKSRFGGRELGPPPGDGFGGGPGGQGIGGRKGGMGEDMFGGRGSGPPQRQAEMKKTWYKLKLSKPKS